MSICMITVDFIAFNERERLTTLICLFCLVSTYLVFDLIAFDPKLNLDKHVPIEHIIRMKQLDITSCQRKYLKNQYDDLSIIVIRPINNKKYKSLTSFLFKN